MAAKEQPAGLALGADEAAGAPVVKKRRTKNYKLREDAARARRSVVLRLPAFEPLTFDSWDAFILAWTQYMARTKTLYRRRSSSTTAYWNTKHKFKKYNVPDSFQYATMAYWCTHGCIQPSRGQGVRTHMHNRYTGCSARITADVVCEPAADGGEMRWCVRVRNQISQHNHRISDEIYNCYSNNSSVPDELLLGAQGDESRAPGAAGRSFDNEEAELDAQTRMMKELEASMDVDTVTGVSRSTAAHPSYVGNRAASRQHTSHSSHAAAVGSSILFKEVLADEQKISMANSELQPIINELKRTSSRVIHKRLQDVSDMVVTLLGKWHQDRMMEESNFPTVINSSSSSSDDQQGVVAASSDANYTSTSSTIASLPAGSQFFLASRSDSSSSVDITLRNMPSGTSSSAEANGSASTIVSTGIPHHEPKSSHDAGVGEARDLVNASVV